jgi:hypothetical protein
MVNPASHPTLNPGRAAGDPRGRRPGRRATAPRTPSGGGDRSGW